MARLLTVPSGWGTAYAPTISELQTLAAALPSNNIAINQAAESFSMEYQSMDAVLGFIQSGGIYVDYCGWPMYYPAAIGTLPAQGSSSWFGSFLTSMGADQYYCDGFDTSQAACMPSYPYDRGWLSGFDISNPTGLIYGRGGVQCSSLVFDRGDSAYPMVAVRSTGGSGVYVYGAAGKYAAVDPGQLAQFVLSVLPSSSAGIGGLQQQCVAGGGVWYDNQCLSQAEYACVMSGGAWVSGQCQTHGGSVTPPATQTNWPLIIGGGAVGLAVILGLVAVAGGK